LYLVNLSLPNLYLPKLYLPDLYLPDLYLPNLYLPDLYLSDQSLPNLYLPSQSLSNVPSYLYLSKPNNHVTLPNQTSSSLTLPHLNLIQRIILAVLATNLKAIFGLLQQSGISKYRL